MKVKKLVVVEMEVDHTEIEPVKPAPDGYRGDMDALEIVPPYKSGKKVDSPAGWGHYAVEVLDPDGNVVGILEDAYGNNGQGKLAASRYYPKVAA